MPPLAKSTLFLARYGIATMKLSALALLAIPAVSAFSPAATGREF